MFCEPCAPPVGKDDRRSHGMCRHKRLQSTHFLLQVALFTSEREPRAVQLQELRAYDMGVDELVFELFLCSAGLQVCCLCIFQ